jgi:hypothetical protein
MHKTTYPCVGQGDVHMDRREPQRRCCWRPIPLADEALYKQAADKPQPAYTKAIHRVRTHSAIHRERTQHPGAATRATGGLTSSHQCGGYHKHYPKRHYTVRQLTSATTRPARMRATTVRRCPHLRAAVCTMRLPYNVPLQHFETKGYATHQAR